MATCNCTCPLSVKWNVILGQFAEGIALVAVTQRSLVAQEIAGDECASLAVAITVLYAVHDQLDAVVNRMPS